MDYREPPLVSQGKKWQAQRINGLWEAGLGSLVLDSRDWEAYFLENRGFRIWVGVSLAENP